MIKIRLLLCFLYINTTLGINLTAVTGMSPTQAARATTINNATMQSAAVAAAGATIIPITQTVVTAAGQTVIAPAGQAIIAPPGHTLVIPNGTGQTIILPSEQPSYQPTGQTFITPAGQIISTAGTYFISAPDSMSNQAVEALLTITGSNITIDLNNLRINCKNTNLITGIRITEGCSNITLRNGILSYFPMGIQAIGTQENPLKNINFQNIILSANNIGIKAEYVQGIFVDNCTTKSYNTAGDALGMFLLSCTNVDITSCNCDSVLSETGSACGIRLQNCSQLTIKKTSTNSLSSKSDCAGIYCVNCSLGSLLNCSSSYNQAEGKSHGFYFMHSSSLTIEGCTASRNAYGFYDDETSITDSNLFIRNVALHNITNYARPNSNEISIKMLNKYNLEESFKVGVYDNVSI